MDPTEQSIAASQRVEIEGAPPDRLAQTEESNLHVSVDGLVTVIRPFRCRVNGVDLRTADVEVELVRQEDTGDVIGARVRPEILVTDPDQLRIQYADPEWIGQARKGGVYTTVDVRRSAAQGDVDRQGLVDAVEASTADDVLVMTGTEAARSLLVTLLQDRGARPTGEHSPGGYRIHEFPDGPAVRIYVWPLNPAQLRGRAADVYLDRSLLYHAGNPPKAEHTVGDLLEILRHVDRAGGDPAPKAAPWKWHLRAVQPRPTVQAEETVRQADSGVPLCIHCRVQEGEQHAPNCPVPQDRREGKGTVGPPWWSERDQKMLAALDQRQRSAEAAGVDTYSMAPSDVRWALDWIQHLLARRERQARGGRARQADG